jgi:hypothetical protein
MASQRTGHQTIGFDVAGRCSGWVSVTEKRFAGGADPTGVADSTEAIQALIAAIGSTAVTVVVPGPVRVESNVTIPSTAPVRFEGAGAFTGTGVVTYSRWMDAATVTATGSTAGREMSDWAADIVALKRRSYPLFVEMVADFNSAGFELPAGYASHPIPGASGYEVVLTVTGAAGATTLTVNSGPVASAGVTSNGWGAAVLHDDGSWGTYTVTASDLSTNVTIKPALRKAVTGGTLANIHDAVNGQHYTPSGYRALAEHLWRYPAFKAYRRGFIAQHREDAATDGPWTEINGLPEAWFASNLSLNSFYSTSPLATVLYSRNTVTCLAAANANGTQGIEWTQPLYGKTGYVDSYIGAQTATAPAHVTVIIDGVTKLDADVYGLERIAVRFANATTGTIRYTFPEGDGGQTQKYRIGTTTWWELPSDIPESIFYDGARVAYVGDSWGTFYSGLAPATLATHVAAGGGTLVNVSEAGQTAQWARDNFQTLVLDNSPDVAVFEFFTNDRNQLTFANIATWVTNIWWLIEQSLQNGIQPVIVMPAATASVAQAQEHLRMAAMLAEGFSSGSSVDAAGASSIALSAPGYTSTAASGANAITLATDGARLKVGSGASAYLYFDGTYIRTPGGLTADGSVFAAELRAPAIYPATTNPVMLRGRAVNGATAVAVKSANDVALSTAGAKVHAFYSDNGTTEVASVRKDASTWGIRLRSPDGTWYLLTIANGGTVSVVADP